MHRLLTKPLQLVGKPSLFPIADGQPKNDTRKGIQGAPILLVVLAGNVLGIDIHRPGTEMRETDNDHIILSGYFRMTVGDVVWQALQHGGYRPCVR